MVRLRGQVYAAPSNVSYCTFCGRSKPSRRVADPKNARPHFSHWPWSARQRRPRGRARAARRGVELLDRSVATLLAFSWRLGPPGRDADRGQYEKCGLVIRVLRASIGTERTRFRNKRNDLLNWIFETCAPHLVRINLIIVSDQQNGNTEAEFRRHRSSTWLPIHNSRNAVRLNQCWSCFLGAGKPMVGSRRSGGGWWNHRQPHRKGHSANALLGLSRSGPGRKGRSGCFANNDGRVSPRCDRRNGSIGLWCGGSIGRTRIGQVYRLDFSS